MMQTIFTLFPWVVVSLILLASLMFTILVGLPIMSMEVGVSLIEPSSSMFAWDKQPNHLLLSSICRYTGVV